MTFYALEIVLNIFEVANEFNRITSFCMSRFVTDSDVAPDSLR